MGVPSFRLDTWQAESQQETARSTYDGNHQKDDYLLDTKIGDLRAAKFEGAASFLDASVAEALAEFEGCGEALASKLALAES